MCIQKVVQLKDDFNAPTFDTTLWDQISPECRVVNQQYQVSTMANSTNYPSIHSRRRYDLTDSELRLDLVDPGNQTLPTLQAYAGGCAFPALTRCVQFLVSENKVYVQLNDNGAYSTLIGDFPLLMRRSLRLRESGGTLHLESLGNGGLWTPLGSAPMPYRTDFMDMRIDIGAGAYVAQPSGSTIIWDNLNSP